MDKSTPPRTNEIGSKQFDVCVAHADDLPARIQGTSSFAEDFLSPGPRDSQGRSLRDLDLKSRMFKYPCSYLIYSPSFDSLPKDVKTYVARRLQNVLNGTDTSDDFAHLSAPDRKAIREILAETKPGLWEE